MLSTPSSTLGKSLETEKTIVLFGLFLIFVPDDLLQVWTICKHVILVFYVAHLEVAQVKAGQRRTAFEHPAHIFHVAGFESAQIKALQL
jgi:hypothetical protein